MTAAELIAEIEQYEAKHLPQTGCTATYLGSLFGSVKRLLRESAARHSAPPYLGDVVEVRVVETAEAANALLAEGWTLLALAAHREHAPDFHLARFRATDGAQPCAECGYIIHRASCAQGKADALLATTESA